ncbi:MAG TPA: HAD family hydrolase [Ignavibacteria bacterium]|nr:HAD family hydrolase [Ignavibacteria bacterium]
MNKAIFLDRDGTINEEVNYLINTEDIRIIPNTVNALRNFKNSGYLNIVITNQSGIARGFLTEEDLDKIHTCIRKILRENGNELIDDIFYSPYLSDGIIEKYKKESPDRKPGTGLILKAAAKFNIDLQESYFIGDSYTDMKCAENAGLRRVLVKTGYGEDTYKKCKEEKIFIDYIAENLFEASEIISKKFIKQ